MATKKKQGADKGRPKKGPTNAGELFLIVQGSDNNFYIAAPAERLPDDYAEALRGYRPQPGDGVFQSPRAFMVAVPSDARLLRLLGGVLPKKLNKPIPPPPPPGHGS